MVQELSGPVGLVRVDNRDLSRISVVAQCLDNQWVTRDLLEHMLARRLSYEDVERRRRQDARAEYLRSILNAEQVIIAWRRAFLRGLLGGAGPVTGTGR